jgi:hypothetical protein
MEPAGRFDPGGILMAGGEVTREVIVAGGEVTREMVMAGGER